jgi:outer membrane protein assembly factor BamA
VAEPNFNIWWQEKNFRRANYGAELYKQNFRGRNESLFLSFKYGFSNQFRLYYRKPWLSAGSNFGISMETSYAEQGEVNIGTTDHVRDFFGRPGERVQIERLASFGVSYRPRLRTWGEVVFGFVNLTITDELVSAAPDYFDNGTGHLRYLRAAARFRHDDRDNPGYPLEGLMFEALLTQRGFGLLRGESIDQTQIQLDHRHHIPLAGRWYAAYTAHLKFNLRGRIPYVVQRGLGYNDLVRGFELRVIDGQHYGLLSGNVKYALIPKKHVKFGERIPALTDAHYAIYWTLFSDVAYARDDFYAHRNPLANTWLASFGTGLDFSTYYDTVIRGELSLNSLGEPGYFMHFRKVF